VKFLRAPFGRGRAAPQTLPRFYDLFQLFRLKVSEQRRKELYAKQGRGNQFRNREERDTWIKNELKTLHRGIRDKETQITNLKEDIDVTKTNQQELEATISVILLLKLQDRF